MDIWTSGYSVALGVLALIIGLVLGGVVPIGMLAALFHGEWSTLFILLGLGALTITARIVDKSDGSFSPESGESVQIQHITTYIDGTDNSSFADSIRLYGYMSNGHFTVTKLDWHHDVHS